MPEPANKVENTGFLSFLQRLAQGISSPSGYDYNRDLLTNIQSDPHYVAAVRESLERTDLPQPEKDRILQEAEVANAASNAVVSDLSYNFDVDKISFANAAVTAGFNGDNDRLAELADEAVAGGGKMPELEETAQTAPVTAAPTLPEDAPAQPEEIVYGEHNPNALQIEVTDPNVSNHSDYEVQRGDSLWKIAKEHWGLESDAEITKAVESIARENGLAQGTDANHIDIGQVLKLPDNPFKQGENLDWAALDQDTKVTSGFNRAFDVAAAGLPVADNINAAPDARPAPRPADFALTA